MLAKSGPRYGPCWMKRKGTKTCFVQGFMRLQKVETKLYKVLYIMSLITVVAKLHILNFYIKDIFLKIYYGILTTNVLS